VVDIYRLWEKFAFLILRIEIFFSHEGGRRYFRRNGCEFMPEYKALNPRKRWATVLSSTTILLN
jgi:hypothetical protein